MGASQFVGRVGGLAVALGVGVAIANGMGAASADSGSADSGPRDANGQAGAYEAALEDNHDLLDPEQPVEILRTIHSFDPCIACAVHLSDPDGGEIVQVKVR